MAHLTIGRRVALGLGFSALTCFMASDVDAQAFDVQSGPYGSSATPTVQTAAGGGSHVVKVEARTSRSTTGVSVLEGLRSRYLVPDRVRTTTSPWIGSGATGSLETFTIPDGQLLASVQLTYTSAGVNRVRVRTEDGTQKIWGSRQSGDRLAHIDLGGHEVIGLVGAARSSRSGIANLGVLFRRKWEATTGVFLGQSSTYGEMRKAPFGSSISRVAIRYTDSAVDWVGGIRFRYRDRDGVEGAWGPWLGMDSGGRTAQLVIPQDDYLQAVTITYLDEGLQWVYSMRLETRNDLFIERGQPGPFEKNFVAGDYSELVGCFGHDGGITLDSFGMFKRPFAGRTWKMGDGCGNATTAKPGFDVSPGTWLGDASFTVTSPAGTVSSPMPGAMVFSPNRISTPLGNCQLFADPAAVVLPVTVPTMATIAFPVSSWDHVGLVIRSQAVLLDVNGAGGLLLTDAFGSWTGGI